MRIVLLVSELNEFKTMVGDIGNAYLTAITGKLVYIVTGPDFGSQEGEDFGYQKSAIQAQNLWCQVS
jgi:hypothetical protein